MGSAGRREVRACDLQDRDGGAAGLCERGFGAEKAGVRELQHRAGQGEAGGSRLYGQDQTGDGADPETGRGRAEAQRGRRAQTQRRGRTEAQGRRGTPQGGRSSGRIPAGGRFGERRFFCVGGTHRRFRGSGEFRGFRKQRIGCFVEQSRLLGRWKRAGDREICLSVYR